MKLNPLIAVGSILIFSSVCGAVCLLNPGSISPTYNGYDNSTNQMCNVPVAGASPSLTGLSAPGQLIPGSGDANAYCTNLFSGPNTSASLNPAAISDCTRNPSAYQAASQNGGAGGGGNSNLSNYVNAFVSCKGSNDPNCMASNGYETPAQKQSDQACLSSRDDAKTVCIDMQMLSALIGQGTNIAASQPAQPIGPNGPSAANLKAQCERAQTFSELGALLNGAKAGTCEALALSCLSSCPKLGGGSGGSSSSAPQSGNPKASAVTNAAHKQCETYQMIAAMDGVQTLMQVAQAAFSGNCNQFVDAPLATLGSPTPLPSAPVDCSIEGNANNPSCASCMANPNAANCAGTAPIAGGGTSGLGTNPGGYSSGIPEGANQAPNTVPVPPSAVNDPSSVTAPGSGPSPLGGNGLQKIADDGSGGGRNPASGGWNTNVLGGTPPGGGAFNYGRPGSGAGAGGGGMSAWDKIKDKLGLDKYLPDKSQFAAGAGANGEITGASGPSIWDKMSRQYQVQSPGMMP